MSQLYNAVSTIALRLLDSRTALLSETDVFHKNRIFSELIEISTPVEISNDPKNIFIGWIMMKSVFLFFIVLSFDQNWQI